MLGQPGWEDQLEQLLPHHPRTWVASGIGLLGHHFMPTFVWRTALDTPGRGGALVSCLRRRPRAAGQQGRLPPGAAHGAGDAATEMRSNYGRFLDAVLPVAEAAGVRLALHPGRPAGARHRWRGAPVHQPGRPRLGDGAEQRQPGLGHGPVPGHGLGDGRRRRRRCAARSTCWDRRGRIFYVHLRQVQGDGPALPGVLHRRGVVLRRRTSSGSSSRSGFDGFLLDDHVPHMTGDTAYGHRARAHAIGYMQGLLAAIEGESLMRIVVTGAAGGHRSSTCCRTSSAHGHDGRGRRPGRRPAPRSPARAGSARLRAR